MKNFKFIPYDKNLVSRSREFRKESTEAEILFWNKVIKNKKLENLKFTRQKPIGHFIVDFYCASMRLAVEIDGEIHNFQKARDKERDNILRKEFGLKIIRYTNKEVINNTAKILEDLLKQTQPIPSPSLIKEGKI